MSRVHIISLGILLFSAVLIGKLFLVQVVHGSRYSEEADKQYATPSKDIFDRGSIFFSQKNGTPVNAATLLTGFKIAINAKNITDEEATYKSLTSVVAGIDHDFFIAKAKNKSDIYEEIIHHISKKDADAVSALKISGISIYKEKWRFYPGASLASRTVGFVAYKGDDFSGRYGIERSYNNTLSRSKDSLYVNFFAEVFSNIGDTLFKNKEKEGDVVLTLEPTVQSFFEKQLASVQEKYKTDSVGGIVINPQNGEIYAMGVLPDFDLNNFGKVKDPLLYSNPLVENVYELGSVIKPLVIAGGIDAGVVTADMKYNDQGYVVVDKKRINNFDFKGRGVIPFQEVLNQSLNTGMVYIEQKLGRDRFRDYMLGYGIGEKTGIDLPHETNSLVSNLQSPRDVEYATASFGQGIALTPIAAARAFSSLANNGTLITPHLVREIQYPDGTKKLPVYPTKPLPNMKKESLQETTRMMVKVVDTSLMQGTVKLPNYSVAAKTGTAQVVKENGGGYYEDKNLHSFFGYFPAYNPQFLILLYAVNPQGEKYASHTLTTPFISTAKFLLNYYQVPPDR